MKTKYIKGENTYQSLLGVRVYGSGNYQEFRYWYTMKFGKRYYSFDQKTWKATKEQAFNEAEKSFCRECAAELQLETYTTNLRGCCDRCGKLGR